MTNTASNRQRIPYYDTVKGICIIQVVLFHSLVPIVGTGYLLSITLSTFLFISGFFFKPEYRTLFRSIDTLVVPYFTTFVLYNVYNVSTEGSIILPRSIWFLYVLFCATVIYWIIIHFVKKTIILSLICILCALLSFLLGDKYNLRNLQIGTILSSVFFFHIGHLFSKYKIHEWKWTYFILPIVLSIIFHFFFYVDQWHLIYSLCYNTYSQDFIITYSILLCGIFAIFMFAKLLNLLIVFTYFGRYSLILLCYHIFILKYTMSPIGAVIILITFPIVVFLIKRYIPFLYGLSPSIGFFLKNRWDDYVRKQKYIQ